MNNTINIFLKLAIAYVDRFGGSRLQIFTLSFDDKASFVFERWWMIPLILSFSQTAQVAAAMRCLRVRRLVAFGNWLPIRIRAKCRRE